MPGENRIGKLRWQCRRGMKELDVLLESFLEHNLETLRSGGFPQLELFLETEDDLMWAWFQHSDRPEREEFAELIEKICGDL